MASAAFVFRCYPGDKVLSYLPLAHIMERMVVACMASVGGAIGFWASDRDTLIKSTDPKYLSDIQELKPDIFVAVPRVIEKLKEGADETARQTKGIKKFLLNKAKKHKTANLSNTDSYEAAEKKNSFLDKKIFTKTKAALGGNVRLILTGAAPLSAELHLWMKVMFGAPVIQGYGLTETCANGTISHPDSKIFGEVGPPVDAVEIKLQDIPDMGYVARKKDVDEEKKDRYGGEILIRGAPVSQGYYKDPEKTAEDFDEDGWFHTGDIGLWTEQGTLKIIDRKKNIFKTAFGEYVSPEALEMVYSQSDLVGQMMVHGDGTEKELVAIVVPSNDGTKAWAAEHGIALPQPKKGKSKFPAAEQFKDWIADDKFKNQLATALTKQFAGSAKDASFKGFERISYVIVVGEFIPDVMLTPTFKLKRNFIREGYAKEIKAAYAAIKKEQARAEAAAKDAKKGAGKEEKGAAKGGSAKDVKKGKEEKAPAKKGSSAKDVKKDEKPAKAEKKEPAAKKEKKEPAKKEVSSSDDSSSDGSSSSEEEKPAKKEEKPAKKEEKPAESSSDDSSSDSSSSSSED
jgi:long-chain acyl-CoA synthetase